MGEVQGLFQATLSKRWRAMQSRPVWVGGERWRVKKIENECLFSCFEKRR